MNISGSGSLPGGEYQETINISGSGKITGSTSCTGFGISGSGKVEGDLHCSGKVKFSGNGKIKGNLDASEVAISGNGEVGGALRCDKCSASGNIKAKSIAANTLHVSGMCRTDEDIAAEDAVFRGGLSVGGLINTEKLDVIFDFGSSANAIGGSFIKIQRKGAVAGLFIRLFGKLKSALFQVNTSIEGDVIDVEYVVAQSVIGRDVKIGPGCKIECVIYGDTIEIDKSAEVGTYKQGE